MHIEKEKCTLPIWFFNDICKRCSSKKRRFSIGLVVKSINEFRHEHRKIYHEFIYIDDLSLSATTFRRLLDTGIPFIKNIPLLNLIGYYCYGKKWIYIDEISEWKHLERKKIANDNQEIFFPTLIDNKEETSKIRNLILEAGQAEFDAYKSLPEINYELLSKYRTYQGPCYYFILDYLIERNEKKLTMKPDDKWSSYNISNIEILEIINDVAIVQSKEAWHLRWFNNNRGDYDSDYTYCHVNEQVYKVVKSNGVWKIDSNTCPGYQNFK